MPAGGRGDRRGGWRVVVVAVHHARPAHHDAAHMMVGQAVVLLAAHLDLVARHRAAADHEGARGAVLAVGLAVRATEYRLDVAGMGVVVLVDRKSTSLNYSH